MGKPCLSTNNRKKNSSNSTCLLLLAAPFLVFAVMTFMATVSIAQAGPMVSITEGDEWRYFKGTQKPPRGWNSSGFDSGSWQKGLSGFGYGKGNNRTYLGDMRGHYSKVYARSEFNVSSDLKIAAMDLSITCDGAFIAYLNGIEVIRNNAPGNVLSNLPPAEKLNISGFAHELVTGKNVLSIECSNDDINSDDFSFIPLFEIIEKQGGAIK